MPLARKDCLMMNVGGSHLHVVLNSPIMWPETGHETVITVNFDSIKPNSTHDTSCVLTPGCHPFVKVPTFVYYGGAQPLSAQNIEQRIMNGEYRRYGHPVSDEVFDLIINGLRVTDELIGKTRRFIKFANI